MKIIPVKMLNKQASVKCVVDDEDYEILKNYRWSLYGTKGGKQQGYARTCFTPRVFSKGDKQVMVPMHRAILWHPEGSLIDHINGNTLDNRKSNLRVCTAKQNAQNRRKSSHNKSGYKGVCWQRGGSKWRAIIKFDGKGYQLGSSQSARSCGLAYQMFAREIFKEFARHK
jgi:hypothetical protein